MHKKILWIEDDYYHIKGLLKPMEKKGYEIVPARTYSDAKILLNGWRNYDLIVLDLILHYSNEFEETLRKKQILSHGIGE